MPPVLALEEPQGPPPGPLAPVTVTDVPGWPLVGAKPVMVGMAGLTVTWLAALPPLSVAVTVVEPAAMAVTVMDTVG
jgi:hypothetical protein